MKTKKYKIIISTLVLLCVFSFIAVVGVLAFDEHGLNSLINVKYSAGKNVVGEVSATYQIGEGTVENMVYDTDKTVITLTGEETANINKALSPKGDIALTKTNRYVVFAYSFNAKDAVDNYTATLTYSDAVDADKGIAADANIKVETSLNKHNGQRLQILQKQLFLKV